jgi:RPA family protein
MSASPGRREVAHRLFAAEYDAADHEYSESDEERAPNYVVTPTGARVNRAFVVGVLTAVESVNDEMVRARLADPTGAFVSYAGQYQPDALAFFESADPPAFVAATGKARTFSPDDSEVVYTSLRPESVNEVDAETRDRWVVTAARRTLGRVAVAATALDTDLSGEALESALAEAGVDDATAAGLPVALEHYGTTEHYLAGLADVAYEALEQVAGQRDEVAVPDRQPDATGPETVDHERAAAVAGVDLPDLDGAESVAAEPDLGEASTEAIAAEAGGGTASETVAAPADESGGGTDETDADDDTGPDSTPADVETDADDGAAPDADVTDEAADEPATADDGDEHEAADADAGEATADAAESDSADADTAAADEDTGTSDEDAAAGDGDTGTSDEDAAAGDGDLGDFEPSADLDEVPDDEEVLDEDERERIEEEFGTEFQTGTEVGDAGEAGIEPDVDPEAAGGEDAAPEGAPDEGEDEADAGEADAAGDDAAAEDAADDEGDADDVDLEDAAVAAMEALDDGDGADREAVVERVVDEHGADPGDVDDAIQDALMAGRCFEPGDGRVQSI